MGAGHNGHAVCRICGAQLVIKSLIKRSMMGLCKAWRNRHEIACAKKTPAQRRAWAKKYADLEYGEGSMSVDLEHPAFQDGYQLSEDIR